MPPEVVDKLRDEVNAAAKNLNTRRFRQLREDEVKRI